MGPAGHCAVGLAAKRWAPAVPLGVLLLVPLILDLLAITFTFAGIEGANAMPWSHGLFMSAVWSALAGFLAARAYRSYRAGAIVGMVLFSHWVLDLISHPIPFSSFSFRTWHWDYGHPMPPDLPLFFGSSPRVGFGLYNAMSAAEATALELAMLAVATALYLRCVVKRKNSRP